MRELLGTLFGQEKAVANARAAATALSRRRVEHDEVELYLDSLPARAEPSPVPAEGWAMRPSVPLTNLLP